MKIGHWSDNNIVNHKLFDAFCKEVLRGTLGQKCYSCGRMVDVPFPPKGSTDYDPKKMLCNSCTPHLHTGVGTGNYIDDPDANGIIGNRGRALEE